MGQVAWRLLELHGLDAHAIFRRHGLSASDIRDPNARIAADKWDAICRDAAPQILDPAFALRVVRCWHPSNLGALGHAWLTSSTLRSGLERLVRYGRLVGERAGVALHDAPDGIEVQVDSGRRDAVVGPILVDFLMALLLDMCRLNHGSSLRPSRVRLRRAAPAGAQAYASFYGCAVEFSADRNSFTLRARDVDALLPTSNRQLAAALDHLLAEQIAHLDKDNVVARCKASVLEQLSSGELSEGEIAHRLHISRRTLQRKLAEAETTYQQLIDDTRRELALVYIEDPRHSITDITFLLGFSQQSAFTRAFRRWTGRAPSDYRARKPVSR
jgi:AraC-like DNA-binding protein